MSEWGWRRTAEKSDWWLELNERRARRQAGFLGQSTTVFLESDAQELEIWDEDGLGEGKEEKRKAKPKEVRTGMGTGTSALVAPLLGEGQVGEMS